ncbi:modifier of mdg4-like [Nymphalis io]|uniref:modifier of mdg4-like n=1 Tax=Inachis io TaxID=171585 RepID=UPI00216A2A98|nr:modifier of mdg4-like [Nymphalis io]XP_050361367.1 modifier of mdg4-like [Nymphalis io]
MAMPEQFSLRWNDFHSNLSQSFQALLEGEDLVDVTLAAGGQYVHAHKLILSVCSPYFKELFKMNPCEHPIVILKDVAHHELRQLLQFMYRGEVHVRQQELSGFLHTAELLQVKGLTGGREKSESPPPVAEEDSSNTQPSVPEPVSDSLPEWVPPGEEITAEAALETVGPVVPKEEAARSPLKRLLKNTTNKNSFNINKKKPRPVNDIPAHAENTEYASDGEPMIDFDNDIFHNLVLPDSGKEAGWNCKTGGVKCPSCHRFFANRYNLKVHIRDKHDTREGTLQCDICQKRMRNPSCLRVHMYHHRKQAAYLAQLSAQGDQMRHVVQNMVENKWRTEAKAEFREAENFPASAPTGEVNNLQPAQQDVKFAPEAILPKTEANHETV